MAPTTGIGIHNCPTAAIIAELAIDVPASPNCSRHCTPDTSLSVKYLNKILPVVKAVVTTVAGKFVLDNVLNISELEFCIAPLSAAPANPVP